MRLRVVSVAALASGACLARRSVSDPDNIAHNACYGLCRAIVADLAWIAGGRRHVEECFRQAKNEAGLDPPDPLLAGRARSYHLVHACHGLAQPAQPVEADGLGLDALAIPGLARVLLGTLAGMETVGRPDKRPPRILEISWGRMQAEGLGAGKDFKLYPGGGRAWDWAETGTRHAPGIQPADVEELLAHGAAAVVLSQGMNCQLQVHPATYRYLEQRSVTVQVAETREAVKIYNELAHGMLVAGLFHTTC
jgi:hypothetical protein